MIEFLFTVFCLSFFVLNVCRDKNFKRSVLKFNPDLQFNKLWHRQSAAIVVLCVCWVAALLSLWLEPDNWLLQAAALAPYALLLRWNVFDWLWNLLDGKSHFKTVGSTADLDIWFGSRMSVRKFRILQISLLITYSIIYSITKFIIL